MTSAAPLRRHGGSATLLALALASCLTFAARADMTFEGDPIPIAHTAGKTGAIRVTIADRSPLSAPAAIIKRMHIKDEPETDYDGAAEVYDLYVPKEPGEGGKYGLMVGAVFKNYGAPPGEWGELLDKHHVIWVCSETVGEDQPQLKRVGTMLDAAAAVRKLRPVQDWRTYASIGSSVGPVAGTALHYADVFDGGALYTVGWVWYAPVPVPMRPGSTWEPKMSPLMLTN